MGDIFQDLDFPRFVVIFGSSGTGKTIMLLECLRSGIGRMHENEIDHEVIVIVDLDIKEKSESRLVHDFTKKYLPFIQNLHPIQPTTLREACKSKLKCSLMTIFTYISLVVKDLNGEF